MQSTANKEKGKRKEPHRRRVVAALSRIKGVFIAYFLLEIDCGTIPVVRKGLSRTSFARKLAIFLGRVERRPPCRAIRRRPSPGAHRRTVVGARAQHGGGRARLDRREREQLFPVHGSENPSGERPFECGLDKRKGGTGAAGGLNPKHYVTTLFILSFSCSMMTRNSTYKFG